MYQIKVPGELRGNWIDWGEELTVTLKQEGENPLVTVPTGILDQAALHYRYRHYLQITTSDRS